jgi:murein DD-endopeptidase MepM/ murein hydrolase activator NlpD
MDRNIRSAWLAGAVLVLGTLAPSCATSGPGAPVFFGRAPKGDVVALEIDKVTLEDKGRTANYSGRKTPGKPSYAGSDVPDRWPVDNEHEVLSPFGPRGRRGRFHAGFDIRAAMRTPVYATADGVVVESDAGGAYGKRVVIDHGSGMSSTYAHLDERQVEVGQEVRAGDQIALSGRSGNATTPHVHYEVHKNGRAVSPKDYLPGYR